MLKEIINTYYLEKQKDRDPLHFYASSVAKCPRQAFFDFKKAPKKALNASILLLFELGNRVHQMIVDAMVSAKDIEVIAAEINIPPQEIVSGRVDAIIKIKDELIILDIKSINGRAFGYLKEAKEDHILQIQLYLYYYKIQKGMLLYVDKDTLKMKEYIVEYDAIVVKNLLKDLEVLRKQIDNNEVPDRLSNYPTFWKCKYCAYSKICKTIDNGKNAWEEFIEKK